MRPVAFLREDRRRIVLFLLTGIVNTAFGFGAYAAAVAVGFLPSVAVVLSTIAGMMFNYRTLGAVFAAKGLIRAPHFVAIYAILSVLNMALLRMAQNGGATPYLGEALALCVVVPLSYLAMRFFVFREAGTTDGTR